MHQLLCLIIIILAGGMFAAAQEATPSPKPTLRAVTPAQINGLYKYDRNDFRILALGHNKLKVQFNGEWMTRGGYPNIGEAIGEATIDGNVATFIPGDTSQCKITMTFLKNKMEVEQQGLDADCGFGHNVVATGTYRRVKAGKPRFMPISKLAFAGSADVLVRLSGHWNQAGTMFALRAQCGRGRPRSQDHPVATAPGSDFNKYLSH